MGREPGPLRCQAPLVLTPSAFTVMALTVLVSTLCAAVTQSEPSTMPPAAVVAEFSSSVSFTWAAPEVAAAVEVPLPADVVAEEISGVTVPEQVSLLGFSLEAPGREGERPRLVLYLAPAPGETAVTFREVGLELALGVVRNQSVGSVTIVMAEAGAGPLDFESSIAAPGAGLYLAVVLRNHGPTEVLLAGVDYLPDALPAGRLLWATATGATDMLAALQREFVPARRRERAPDRRPVEGFAWLSPEQAGIKVGPGESLVLAWSDESLPEPRSSSYLLRPVVHYVAAGVTGQVRRLGLPAAVRAP